MCVAFDRDTEKGRRSQTTPVKSDMDMRSGRHGNEEESEKNGP